MNFAVPDVATAIGVDGTDLEDELGVWLGIYCQSPVRLISIHVAVCRRCYHYATPRP